MGSVHDYMSVPKNFLLKKDIQIWPWQPVPWGTAPNKIVLFYNLRYVFGKNKGYTVVYDRPINSCFFVNFLALKETIMHL